MFPFISFRCILYCARAIVQRIGGPCVVLAISLRAFLCSLGCNFGLSYSLISKPRPLLRIVDIRPSGYPSKLDNCILDSSEFMKTEARIFFHASWLYCHTFCKIFFPITLHVFTGVIELYTYTHWITILYDRWHLSAQCHIVCLIFSTKM